MLLISFFVLWRSVQCLLYIILQPPCVVYAPGWSILPESRTGWKSCNLPPLLSDPPPVVLYDTTEHVLIKPWDSAQGRTWSCGRFIMSPLTKTKLINTSSEVIWRKNSEQPVFTTEVGILIYFIIWFTIISLVFQGCKGPVLVHWCSV